MLEITIMGLEPKEQLDVAIRSKNFLVDIVVTYSVLTFYSRDLHVPLWVLQEKQLQEYSPED